MSNGLSRRDLLGASALATASLLVPRPLRAARREPAPLVLYCSADPDLARPIIDAFTKQTGTLVKPVFDTEATKTTGLVNRLLAEKDRPRADVWWSSEPFGTIRLARAGVLEPYTSTRAEEQMAPQGGWPVPLRAADRSWYGFGSRARVIAFNTAKPDQPAGEYFFFADSPQSLGPRRFGMARPQFGTTRGHMAAFVALHGEKALADCLRSMKASGLRLYDGNATVVRALASGEISAGLTDSDDVFAGQGRDWQVNMHFEKPGTLLAQGIAGSTTFYGCGPLYLPNTAAIVRSASNPAAAAAFIDHLLATDTQRALAMSESRNIPVDPALRTELSAWAAVPQTTDAQNFERIADHINAAMRVCDEVLG